jgi:hypothetical protein
MGKEKVFDIDAYLVDNGITIKLGGKEFTVNDIPYEAQEMMKAGNQKEALKIILGCEEADLVKYGIAAISQITRNITEVLFPEPSPKDQ